MGFLERLRQEKERKDLEQEELWEQEERARELIKVQEYVARQESMKREKQARLFREESGIEDLLNEMGQMLKAGVHTRADKSDSVFNTFGWDSKYDEHKGNNNCEKYFEVEVTPDGDIKFLASKYGTSTIQRTQWLGNKLVLEEALEKAYSHPTTRRWSEYYQSYQSQN